MNKKLLLTVGILSMLSTGVMADNITQDPGSITVWRTSNGDVTGNTYITSSSISVNDSSTVDNTGEKNRTLITTDNINIHTGTFDRNRTDNTLYPNGIYFNKYEYKPDESSPFKQSWANLNLNYGVELRDRETNSGGTTNNDLATSLNTKELRMYKTKENSIYSQIEVESNGLKVFDMSPDGANRKKLEFSSKKVDVGNQTINNVSEGVDGTDAVNVNQLKNYVDSKIVKSGNNITITKNLDWFGSETNPTVDLNKDVDLTEDGSLTIGKSKLDNQELTIKSSDDRTTTINGTAMGIDGELGSTLITTANIGLTDRTTGSNSTMNTEGTQIQYNDGDNGLVYETNYNYDGMVMKTFNGNHSPINEISLTTQGLNNGNNKIINVSRGENDTDAVNVSQLKEVENKINNIQQNALNQANHYTDLQVNKGVAKASALAGLKYLDYNPRDKWSFAASVGHYRNANAVAVGMAYQPNENTMVHGGVTLDGKVAYNLGVSFKTGGQKCVNKYNLQDQVRQLQSDNAELRQELAELRSMIEKK